MMSNSWHSYSKIYALGHLATKDIFDGPVVVEEKIDGSQFSFGLFEEGLRVRSRGRVFDVHAPDDLFKPACATVVRLRDQLRPGWTYRGETLKSPRHNALIYGRVPVGNVIIFDIETSLCTFLGPEEKAEEAARLGLECVPHFYSGMVTEQETLNSFKETTSCLGGQKIEGFVVKAYDQFTKDKKVLMGKWVSEQFKETHKRTWKADNPTSGDILEKIREAYRTMPRWQKAVQHLAEAGKLQGAPQDIPALIKEVQQDVREECSEEIKEVLFKWAWKRVSRELTRGLPEWYKQELMEGLFQ